MGLRQLGKSTKLIFGILAAILVAGFFGMGIFAAVSMNNTEVSIDLPAGTVIYDNTFTPIELQQPAHVTQNSMGQYVLESEGSSVVLGKHTIASNGSGIKVLGGGYLVNSDAMVAPIDDSMDFQRASGGALYKLADRKYCIQADVVSDDGEKVSTENYMYIVMDVAGNAAIYSNTLSLKTVRPTIVKGGKISFDIANEKLTVGDQEVKMARLIESSNMYDSGIVKLVDEAQTPDEINIDIKGGDGGKGGIGGTGGRGGTGGIGGSGGMGGTGGKGGSGGSGGTGGKGGNGGKGGTGGDGGVGDEVDITIQTQIISAISHTASSITVKYNFLDPFGRYGLVFLELHPADELIKRGLTISRIYNETSDEVMDYWEYYDSNIGDDYRVSIDQYLNSYTFNGLQPDTSYYVVMAHQLSDSYGTVLSVLDDFIKSTTMGKSNAIVVDSITGKEINILISLETANECSTPGKLDLYDDNGKVIRDEVFSEDDARQAAESGYVWTVTFTSADTTKLSDLQYIKAALLNVDGAKVLSVRTKNSFYEKGNQSTSSDSLTVTDSFNGISGLEGDPVFNDLEGQ